MLVACGDVREVSGVYAERVDTIEEAERRYALRMTLFEYDGFVGGWVEYYALGGINREDTPYVRADYCTYFGPYRRTGGVTVLRAQTPAPGKPIVLRMEADGRSVQYATTEQADGIVREGETVSELIFEKQSETAEDGCPSSAIPLDTAGGMGARPAVMRGARAVVEAL